MSQFGTGDLASVLIQPDQEHAGFAQGIIRSWNASTFENTVSVRGTDLDDLPVASGVEALTYQPGDVVMLTRWRPNSGRGTATYWIGSGGRAVFPGEGRAEQTIEFLQTQLAKSIVDELVQELLVSPAGQELAAFVLGQRVHADTINSLITNPGGSYTASGGPTLNDIEVSDARRMLITVSARIGCQSNVSGTGAEGWMGFNISGASSISPVDNRTANLFLSTPNDVAQVIAARSSFQVALGPDDGLNAGTHTVSARYRHNLNGSGSVSFLDRTISVIAF